MIKISVLLMLLMSMAAAKEMTHVTLQLEWKHQFQFAGLYAAQKQGYYSDKGIKLELLEYEEGMDVPEVVSSGKADFGISSSQLALERMRGRPIVLLASYFKQNALALAVQPEITSVSQLKGKKIMAVQRALKHSNLALMLQNEGLRESDYTVVPHKYVIDPFVNGEVDAMTVLVSSQPYELQQAEKAYNILNPADYGLYSYDMELFTSEAFAMQNPALVQDFIEATKKGWQYAFANKEEMVDYIYENLSKRKTKEALAFEADMVQKLFKREVFTIGSVAPELIALNAQMYEKLGLVEGQSDFKDLLQSYAFEHEKYKNMLDLTPEEKTFLQKLQTVRVYARDDYEPFTYTQDGRMKGYVHEILQLLQRYLGVEFSYSRQMSPARAKEKLREKRLDMIASLRSGPDNKEYSTFSRPLLQNTLAVASSDKNLQSLDDLQNKTVGVVADTYYARLLQERYSHLNLRETASRQEGLQLLKEAEVDAFVCGDTVLKYLLAKHNMYHLDINVMQYDPAFISMESLGIRSDWPLLASAVDKALDAIAPATFKALRDKWQNIEPPAAKGSISLNSEQKRYLRENPTLRVHNETDWAPYNYHNGSEARGLSIDYMKLLAAKAGFNVEFVTGPSWNEFMQMLQNGQIDVMLNIADTPQRREYFTFTKPYMQTQTVVYTTDDVNYAINSVEQLAGRKVAVIKGFVQQDIFEKNYPKLKLVETDSVLESLQAVKEGRAFAVVGSYGIYNHTIDKHDLNTIKAHPFLSHEELNTELAMATNKENPILRDILEKARQSVSFEEFETIKQRWLDYEEHNTKLFNERILSTQQLQYLRQKGEIKVCIDPDWMPFESLKEGKHIGMGADFFAYFQKYLNVDVTIVPTDSWSQSLTYARQRKCDLLSLAMETPDRKEYMNFTAPYLSIPLVLATRKNVTFVDDFEQIRGKKLAIVKDYAFSELLRQRYPNVKLQEVATTKEGLSAVARGEYFGFIGTLASVGYHFQHDFTGELKVAGKFDEKWELAVGVRNDDAMLLDIFDTVIATLDDAKKQEIFNKWIAVTYETGRDYTLVWQVALAALLILGVIVYWNRRLQLLNKELFAAKEKAQEATRAKSSFLANMSHEIRTPMNAIIGLLYLLKHSPLNDKQLDQVGKIETSANNLLNIINDILDFSKIEAGKIKIESIDFNLEEVIANVRSMTEFKARQKGLEFVVRLQEDMPTALHGDPYRITQVLINLVGNAVKFTDEGSVQLDIDRYKQRYRFRISDTGIGLDKKQQKHLFDSFTQADASTTRNYGGTGLGLAISKQLVELMGGVIGFESKYKQGSVFYFLLPLKQQADPYANTRAKPEKFEPKALHSGVILLAEDNSTNREIIASLLEDSPVIVDMAGDGSQAVQMYAKNPGRYDLVLMDIQMPVMDGYEAGKEILQTDKDAVIIALSANAMKEDFKKSKQSGFVDHINKPIDVEKFYETLRRYVAIKKPRAQQEVQNSDNDCVDSGSAIASLGAKEVFFKVAATFLAQYATVSLHTLEKSELSRAVHSLKGLGANVGAPKLQQLASEYEQNQSDESLQRLQESLDCVVGRLQELVPGQETSKRRADEKELHSLWQQLERALLSKRPNRIEAVMGKLEKIQMDGQKQETFDTIKQLVLQYKFKEAAQLLG
ncbi:MAG: transporter substrate-binding domain-containing protein [Campylobacterota bacterium]